MADTTPPIENVLAAQGFAPPDGQKEGGGGKKPDQDADGQKPSGGESSEPKRPIQHPSRKGIVIAVVVVVVLFVALLLVGLLPRRSKDKQMEARARQAALADSVPTVNVSVIGRADTTSDLSLPGSLQANREAAVYARATGYVKRWMVDIGARVHTGQLMAIIDAPDLDQQLAQSRETAANQRAQLELNKVNLDRWKVLYHDSAVTRLELDQYQTNFNLSVASVAAAEADVRRLEALVGYEQILAPFDGVVTARNVEEGVFVTAGGTINSPLAAATGGNTLTGNTTGGVTQLFTVARTDTVRVYIGVPQSYAPSVHRGLGALLEVAELPGHSFFGHVTRSANAVDGSSRTLLTEVDILNTTGELLPGMYAQVHFRFERASPPLLMPATALIFRLGGAQAAVVGADSVLRFANLRIGRDYGTVMEVDSGLTAGQYVVAQPSDELRNGVHVHTRLEPAGGAPGANGSAGAAGGGSQYRPAAEFDEGFPGSPVTAPPSPPPPPPPTPRAPIH
jgi:multidrug efflux pump subunit AcrA (membrane-fusion protein)